jgi:hypothetical protein
VRRQSTRERPQQIEVNMPTATYATTIDPARDQSPALKRVSWPAIFAGAVVTVSLQVLLSMLGVGIGLGTVDPASTDNPGLATFGIGAGLWWLASTLVSLVVGGYTAAWLAGITLRFDGMLHGLVTWGVTLLLTFYLLGSAVGGAIGGAFNLVGNVTGAAASAAGEGIRAAAPQIAEMAPASVEELRERARDFLRPSGADPATLSPEDAQAEIAANLPRLAAGGQQAEQAEQRIVAIMAAQLRVPPEEAQRRFDEAQAQMSAAADQARATATQAADQAASTASTGSFMAFAALLLGAIAAAGGGAFAVQRRAYAVS